MYWKSRELERLRECYPTMLFKDLLREFAPRSKSSIVSMANRLGLVRQWHERKDWKAVADAHVPMLTFGPMLTLKVGEVVE